MKILNFGLLISQCILKVETKELSKVRRCLSTVNIKTRNGKKQNVLKHIFSIRCTLLSNNLKKQSSLSDCQTPRCISSHQVPLLKTPKKFQLRQTSLKEIRTWILEQPHLRGCCRDECPIRLDKASVDSDNFLLRFLRVKKFNIKKASKMMDRYRTMRCANPHWFMNLDPTANKHVQELVSIFSILIQWNKQIFVSHSYVSFKLVSCWQHPIRVFFRRC